MLKDQAWLQGRVVVRDECWIWTGYCDRYGYGRYSTGWHGDVLVHRISYRLFVGPIPDGCEIDHLCRVRACANPAHLEAIAHAENVRRGVSGRVTTERQRGKTHCPRGHTYSGSNLYVSPRGDRQCRVCRKEAGLRLKQRHPERVREQQRAAQTRYRAKKVTRG